MNNKMENKYLFAHYLRGLAAISVVIAHYGTAFFNSNDGLAPLVNAPQVKDRTYPWIIGFIPQDFPGFLGVFGVTIFFIISGFVIPLSIEKYNIKTFLLKRFFRLYPTYFAIRAPPFSEIPQSPGRSHRSPSALHACRKPPVSRRPAPE